MRWPGITHRASVAAFTAAWDGPRTCWSTTRAWRLSSSCDSPQGWETQFAVNHLGHFALTVGLHGALAAAEGAQVVSLGSPNHLTSPVVFDDIHFAFRLYEPWTAYGQSECANTLWR